MNYYGQVLSNEFRVRDAELVQDILGYAGYSTGITIVEDKSYVYFWDNDDGAFLSDSTEVIYYKGIPSAASNDCDDNVYNLANALDIDEDEIDEPLITTQPLEEFLQEQLLEGESVQVTEVGHEGLRYNSAVGLVITKKAIKWFGLNSLMDSFAKENI